MDEDGIDGMVLKSKEDEEGSSGSLPT